MSHLGRRLSALIDQEVTGAERDRILAHLAACRRCRQEAIALRALKRRLHALGEATAEAELPRRAFELAVAAAGQHRPGPAARVAAAGRAAPAGRGRARAITAAAVSLLAAGFAAAAFLAGGGSGGQQPGPNVTPAVDVFMTQHVLTNGTVPTPQPGGSSQPGPALPGGRSAGKP